MPRQKTPEPLALFKKLYADLAALGDEGSDSPEADAIRDKMDWPWIDMTEAERDEARRWTVEHYG